MVLTCWLTTCKPCLSTYVKQSHGAQSVRRTLARLPAHACRLVQVMDFGWVQFTEAKILSEYIKTDAYKMEVSRQCTRSALNGMFEKPVGRSACIAG